MEMAPTEPIGARPVETQLPYTDALPYYDREIDTIPNMRELVDQEIEAEKKRLNYDPQTLLPPAHAVSALLAEELARAERGEKLEALDTQRYQLDAPAQGLKAPEEAWEQSVRNAEVQLAHMDGRLKNIELLRRYGPNVWRLHNYDQESMLQLQTQAGKTVEETTTEVNRARKEAQLAIGDKLSTLESRWAALVSKNLSIRAANLTAAAEIEEYQQRARQVEHELAQLDAASA
ncbi:hypothetical protein MBRA1_003000 [Malassezia brasiliensis]|uniref:Pre-mRNA-splicing factor SPF27 n=1 Tax=Malassezia brasiliensis TaxID=1821822 RepID=A0AAF0DUH3_9BASI|nr:hypothetical protein MBRA1_003000 [Malassezia brasiliensis]